MNVPSKVNVKNPPQSIQGIEYKEKMPKSFREKTEDNKDNLQVKRNHASIWDLTNSHRCCKQGNKAIRLLKGMSLELTITPSRGRSEMLLTLDI